MNHLQTVAQGMSPGTWALLNDIGDGSGYGPPMAPPTLLADGAWFKLFDYSNKCAYDWGPVTDTAALGQYAQPRRVMYHGHGHLTETDMVSLQGMTGNICYDLDTNLWTKVPTEQFSKDAYGANLQSYGHVTCNPATKQLIYWLPGTFNIVGMNVDYANPANINLDGTTDVNYPTGFLSPVPWSTSQPFGGLEYFPDRDELCSFDQQYLWVKKGTEDAWTLKYTTPGTWPLSGSIIYNPRTQTIMFGGGSNNAGPNYYSNIFYIYHKDGTITTCAPAPITQLTPTETAAQSMSCGGSGLVWADSVSGKYCFLMPVVNAVTNTYTDRRFYEYDVAADTWTRRPDIEPNVPAMGMISIGGSLTPTNNDFFDCVCVNLWDMGVTIFLGIKCWLYKHAVNNWAENNGPDFNALKSVQPGRVNFVGFDTPGELKRNWSSVDTIYTAAVNALPSGHDKTNYAATSANFYGNMSITPTGTTLSATQIDTTIYSAATGGTGSMRFDRLNYNPGNQGEFMTALDGTNVVINDNSTVLDGSKPFRFSPESPYGRTYYIQHRMRVNALELNTAWRGVTANYTDFSSDAAGGHKIIRPGAFTADMVGWHILIGSDNGGFVQGIYPITTVVDANSVIVGPDLVQGLTSPTPTTIGAAGAAAIGGDPVTHKWYACLSAAQNSATLVRNVGPYGAYDPFDSAMVGKTILIKSSFSPSGGVPILGTGFDGGIYTIVSVIDANHLILNAAPCTTMAGSSGWARMGSITAGWKINSEADKAQFTRETTVSDSGQWGMLNVYANRGQDSAPLNVVVPFLVDTWQTACMRQEIRGKHLIATSAALSKDITSTWKPHQYEEFGNFNPVSAPNRTYWMVIRGTTGAWGTGRATIVDLVNAGTGYTTGTVSCSGGTGSGLTLAITASGGVIQGVNLVAAGDGVTYRFAMAGNVVNAGSGYTIGDVVTIGGGTGGTGRIIYVDYYLTDLYTDPGHVRLHCSPTPTAAGTDGIAYAPNIYQTLTSIWLEGKLCTTWGAPHGASVTGDLASFYVVNDPFKVSGAGDHVPEGRQTLQLLQYHTSQDYSQVLSGVASMWYDDLIVSTQPSILTPSGGGGVIITPPPSTTIGPGYPIRTRG